MRTTLVFAMLFGSLAQAQTQPASVTKLSEIKDQISEVRLTSNLSPARAFLTAYTSKNNAYLTRIYSIISQINAKSPQARVQMVVSIPDNFGPESMFGTEMRPSGEPLAAFNEWLGQLKLSLKLPQSAEVPYLVTVQNKDKQNPWMQDIGEFALIKLKGENDFKPVFLDTNYDGGNAGSSQGIDIAKKFGINTVNVENYEGDQVSDGDRGGNIEATHEGRLMLGTNASKRLQANLAAITRQQPIMIDTSFLLVGHVDEVMSILPTNDGCGGGLAYADPSLALILTWQNPRSVEQYPMLSEAKESIRYFLKPAARTKPTISRDDFDFNRKPRLEANGLPNELDYHVYRNLQAYRTMLKNVESVRQASKCLKTVVAIPSYFSMSPEYDFGEMYEKSHNLMPLSGSINHVILNRHLLLPEGVFAKQIANILSLSFDLASINLISGPAVAAYTNSYGSIHCSSNAIRTEAK